LDVRFKRSENNSADIMTKNMTRDVHDKHSKSIRKDTLEFWKEDVKQDTSVSEFTQSRAFSLESYLLLVHSLRNSKEEFRPVS
jgi:hypothetical protein